MIKDFNDNDGRCLKEYADYLISLDNNFLIIKIGNKFTRKFSELYRIPLDDWYNIKIDRERLDNDRKKITIETDILQLVNEHQILRKYRLSFIPIETYFLNKFLSYFDYINRNNLNGEKLKLIEDLKEKEIKDKIIEEENKRIAVKRQLEATRKLNLRIRKNEISRLAFQLLKIREQKILMSKEKSALKAEIRKDEMKRIAQVKKNEKRTQLKAKRIIAIVSKLEENAELERVFSNYFSKYVGGYLLKPNNYKGIAINILKKNNIFNEIKTEIPLLDSLVAEPNKIYNGDLKGFYKMAKYVGKTVNKSVDDYTILLTWLLICNAANKYYTKYFCETYDELVGKIRDLDLEDSIGKYLASNILCEEEETNGMYVYLLMSLKKFEEKDRLKGYPHCFKIFQKIYRRLKNEKDYESFINKLLSEKKVERTYTIEDVDLLNGIEFEQFISTLFVRLGFKTAVTKSTKDQGVDIIAEKDKIKYAIQTKCYANTVSNSAIQEVVAGLSFYQCDKAVVVTNSFFTDSAIELAKANGVILWDRNILKQKLFELY